MDMVTGGLQDKVKASTKALNNDDKAKTSMFESMLYTNLSGIGAGIGFYFGRDDGGLHEAPCGTDRDARLLVASAIGQVFIYYTVTEFGRCLDDRHAQDLLRRTPC